MATSRSSSSLKPLLQPASLKSAVYIAGTRFRFLPLRLHDMQEDKSQCFAAWLMDLSIFTKDALLDGLIPEAVHWRASLSYDRDKSPLPHLPFSGLPPRKSATSQPHELSNFTKEFRSLTILPVCSICGQDDHAVLACPDRSTKMSSLLPRAAPPPPHGSLIP